MEDPRNSNSSKRRHGRLCPARRRGHRRWSPASPRAMGPPVGFARSTRGCRCSPAHPGVCADCPLHRESFLQQHESLPIARGRGHLASLALHGSGPCFCSSAGFLFIGLSVRGRRNSSFLFCSYGFRTRLNELLNCLFCF